MCVYACFTHITFSDLLFHPNALVGIKAEFPFDTLKRHWRYRVEKKRARVPIVPLFWFWARKLTFGEENGITKLVLQWDNQFWDKFGRFGRNLCYIWERTKLQNSYPFTLVLVNILDLDITDSRARFSLEPLPPRKTGVSLFSGIIRSSRGQHTYPPAIYRPRFPWPVLPCAL